MGQTMRILILAIHYPVASGRYAFDALKRLGHDVRSAGPSTGRDIWGMQVDEKYVWTASKIEDGWTPELVIIMDSALTYNRLDSAIGNIPAVVFGVDNHCRTYEQFDGYVDHFFLAHGHGFRIGEPNVTWLPCGYDPAIFTPFPSWHERAWDAAMIGVQYASRGELLYALREALPHIRLQYGAGKVYNEYAAIYQQSKISLVVSANHDVAQRVWETAAMGCLLVMDQCPDAEALGLVDGVNCLMYHDIKEATDQVFWAVTHQKEAAQIATAGQAWALPGTWDARLQVIVEWAEAQRQPKKATGKR